MNKPTEEIRLDEGKPRDAKTIACHMREIIKLSNYKRFGSKTRIIFKGEAKEDPKDQPDQPAKKPQ